MKRYMKMRGGFKMSPSFKQKAWETAKPYAKAAAGAGLTYLKNKLNERVYIPKSLGVRKREINYHEATTGNISLSKSSFGKKRKLSKLMIATTAKMQDHFGKAGVVRAASYDIQGVSQFSVCTGTELTTLTSDFNAYFGISGAAGANTRVQKMFIEKAEGVLCLQSAGNTSSTVDIYECFPRHDMSAARDPKTAFDAINETGTTAEPFGSSNISATPFMSPSFTQGWYVRRVKTVEMAAGSGHKHEFCRYVNKMTSGERYNTTVEYMTGMSMAFLLVIRGTPVHDTVTSTNIAIGPANVDVKINYTISAYRNPVSATVNADSASKLVVTTANQVLVNTVVDSLQSNV